MADNGKGTIMGRLSCGWVHEWLPLLVDDSDGLACEDNDLDAQDRRRIEGHLTECSRCRRHQAELGMAISILGIAATETSGQRTPSIWPELEERIQRHQEQCQSGWLRSLRGTCPEGIRIIADRLLCGCSQIRGNMPLQLAWTRDSLGDFLTNQVWPLFQSKRPGPGKAFGLATWRGRVGLSFSLAAAGLILFLLFVSAQRRQNQGDARIAADTVLPDRIELLLPELPELSEASEDEASEDVVAATSSATLSRVSNSLSLATPAAPAAEISMGQSAPAKKASTMTTTTAMETSAPRYDFDLEHGTPMPPETRTSKPAY
jgi:hypothetical protein